jgi:hypothetical protein
MTHAIMVIKRGSGSGLTVGRLNTICSFTRVCIKDKLSEMEGVAVLPRNSKSGGFSRPGDSGSAVVDGKGRLAGLLTKGTLSGKNDESDCTYITPIDFLLKCMLKSGVKANLSPSLSRQ